MNIIIACQTLRDEVEKALQETGINYPVIWIDSGLHNYPDKLRTKLQEQIDRISNVENIILVFGYCGNALSGIYAKTAKLILPQVDDCISLLLGSVARRLELTEETKAYFLTRGWVIYENNILKEYQRCLEKYGQEKAKRIFKSMLVYYKKLMVLDTSAYPLEEVLEKAQEFADNVGLEQQVVSGTLEYLKKLLTGPWDEDFVVLPPGQVLSLEEFGMVNFNKIQNSGIGPSFVFSNRNP